jgi:hypothetical protein
MKIIVPFDKIFGKFYFYEKNKNLFIKLKYENQIYIIKKRSEANKKHEGKNFDEIQFFQIGKIMSGFQEHLKNTENYFENEYMVQMTQNSFEDHMDKTHYVKLVKSFKFKNLTLESATMFHSEKDNHVILYFDTLDSNNSVKMKKWSSDDHSENNWFDLWNKETIHEDIRDIFTHRILKNVGSQRAHSRNKILKTEKIRIAKHLNITFEYNDYSDESNYE